LSALGLDHRPAASVAHKLVTTGLMNDFFRKSILVSRLDRITGNLTICTCENIIIHTVININVIVKLLCIEKIGTNSLNLHTLHHLFLIIIN